MSAQLPFAHATSATRESSQRGWLSPAASCTCRCGSPSSKPPAACRSPPLRNHFWHHPIRIHHPPRGSHVSHHAPTKCSSHIPEVQHFAVAFEHLAAEAVVLRLREAGVAGE